MSDTTLGAATGAMMHRRHVLGLGLGFTATILLGSGARAQQTSVKFWDPGLFAVSADGILNKDRSFIYKAVEAYQAANPGETIEITENSGDITTTTNQVRAPSIARNGPGMKRAYAGGRPSGTRRGPRRSSGRKSGTPLRGAGRNNTQMA